MWGQGAEGLRLGGEGVPFPWKVWEGSQHKGQEDYHSGEKELISRPESPGFLEEPQPGLPNVTEGIDRGRRVNPEDSLMMQPGR